MRALLKLESGTWHKFLEWDKLNISITTRSFGDKVKLEGNF